MPLDTTAVEAWLPVQGWPYEVSSHGNVRRSAGPLRGTSSVGFILKPRMVRGRPGTLPYAGVVLRDGKRRRSVLVHVLVLDAFVGPRPSSSHQCNHVNGDKLANYVRNLEWVTPSENIRHAILIGLNPPGPKNVKIGAGRVSEIRERFAAGARIADLASEFMVHYSTIRLIVVRKTWAHVP